MKGQDCLHYNTSKTAASTHVPILIEHPNDTVSEVEDVPPVKIRHVSWTVLWWAVVQEVQDVFGGEQCLLQTPVNEIHH